jgi:hypothetical protein
MYIVERNTLAGNIFSFFLLNDSTCKVSFIQVLACLTAVQFIFFCNNFFFVLFACEFREILYIFFFSFAFRSSVLWDAFWVKEQKKKLRYSWVKKKTFYIAALSRKKGSSCLKIFFFGCCVFCWRLVWIFYRFFFSWLFWNVSLSSSCPVFVFFALQSKRKKCCCCYRLNLLHNRRKKVVYKFREPSSAYNAFVKSIWWFEAYDWMFHWLFWRVDVK